MQSLKDWARLRQAQQVRRLKTGGKCSWPPFQSTRLLLTLGICSELRAKVILHVIPSARLALDNPGIHGRSRASRRAWLVRDHPTRRQLVFLLPFVLARPPQAMNQRKQSSNALHAIIRRSLGDA